VPRPVPPIQRPGLRPAIRAALWATIVSTFRICAFLIGALMLAYVVGMVGVLAIFLVSNWIGVMPFGSELPVWAKSGTIGASQMVLGPATSLVVAFARIVVAAYVGMHVPVRTATKSSYPIERIRVWVAGIGGAALALLWVVPLAYDPILAVGMLALPAAFAIGALRGPVQPRVAKGWRPYVGLAAIILVAELAQLPVIVAAGQMQPVDSAAVGLPTTAIGVTPQDLDVSFFWGSGADDIGDTWVFWPDRVDPSTLLTSVRTEIWPVRFNGLAPALGPAATSVQPHKTLRPLEGGAWSTPTPKAPEPIAIYAIGITLDGRRIMLGTGPQIQMTPQWWGPAVAFFLGG